VDIRRRRDNFFLAGERRGHDDGLNGSSCAPASGAHAQIAQRSRLHLGTQIAEEPGGPDAAIGKSQT
jgi:hypothetical protein